MDDLFHSGHLVMRSERCAVKNQRIALISNVSQAKFELGLTHEKFGV